MHCVLRRNEWNESAVTDPFPSPLNGLREGLDKRNG